MQKELLSRLERNKKEVVKQNCHSKPRPILLGRAPQGCNAGSISSTQVVSQRQQPRQSWKMLNQVQHDGLFYNGGFTLIELLVVVLIIGILTAVALPQYQKAVMKSRLMSMMPLLKAIDTAEREYYLANGTYTGKFDDLTLDMPSGALLVEEGYIRYKNFHCWIDESVSAYCNHNQAPKLEKYFDRDVFYCAGTDTAQIALCKSLAGGAEPAWGTTYSFN